MNNQKKRVKTPITYYGGKQQLVPTILPMIPRHRIYCEPYFGGGAVFFAKPPSYLEAINDINENLVTFYLQLQNNFDALFDMVQHTLCCESEWKRARAIWQGQEATPLERAWAVWMLTNFSFSGSPDGGWKWCNGSAGSHSGRVMRHSRENFTEALHDRLKDVQISCRDALLCIEQRDTPDTFFYLDPPYPGCVQKHYRGFTFENLEELLTRLESIKGKFLLSNFMSDTLNEFIARNGWNVKAKTMAMKVANFKGHSRSKTEILVFNYDIENTLFD
ncbi:MAG: DNA adenine methylase [Bacteroidaceae bacterium]|nr:DNA adenine methylase [Bacteroidaceae bacterium]